MEQIAPFQDPDNDVDDTADGNGNNKFLSLPESVVHHIFSSLETIDVMSASCVSTDWRYLCTTIPHLNFTYETYKRFGYEKYKDLVNWVLMAHDKSVSIRTCHLFCLNDGDDQSLYRWFRILAQKHVQQLHLLVRTESGDNIFDFPRFLLASDSLEVLEINLGRWMLLRLPSYGGFTRLKTLTLVNTSLNNQDLFRNLISNCPLLENLSIKGCGFYHDFRVLEISSGNLRKFVCDYDDCPFLSPLDNSTTLEIKLTCPNLVYFCLIEGLPLQNFYWDKIPPFLQTAIICPEWDYDITAPNVELACHFLKILGGFYLVEILELNSNSLQLIYPAVAKPGCFYISFYNLKFLTVSIENGRNFQPVIYLLKCAPYLQRLSVHFVPPNEERDWGIPDKDIADEDIPCLRFHLETVKLIAIDSADDKLEPIRFFLKNGYVLQKMSIVWRKSMNRKARRDTFRKVLKFPRSSNVSFSLSELKNDDEL